MGREERYMSEIMNINAYVSSAHKVSEEDQVKAGKVKPGENIPHLKGAETAQLHMLLSRRSRAQCCLFLQFINFM